MKKTAKLTKAITGGLLSMAMVGSCLPLLTASAGEITGYVRFLNNSGSSFSDIKVENAPNYPDLVAAMDATGYEGWKVGSAPIVSATVDTNEACVAITVDDTIGTLEGKSLSYSAAGGNSAFLKNANILSWKLNWKAEENTFNSDNKLDYKLLNPGFSDTSTKIVFSINENYVEGDNGARTALTEAHGIDMNALCAAFNASTIYSPGETYMYHSHGNAEVGTGSDALSLINAKFDTNGGTYNWGDFVDGMYIDVPEGTAIPGANGKFYTIAIQGVYTVAEIGRQIIMYLIPIAAPAPPNKAPSEVHDLNVEPIPSSDITGYRSAFNTTVHSYDVALRYSDNMVFVYDKGLHSNIDEAAITGPSISEDNTLYKQPEVNLWLKSHNAQTIDKMERVGKWYGLDGSANAIFVVNRGSNGIGMDAVAVPSEGLSIDLFLGARSAAAAKGADMSAMGWTKADFADDATFDAAIESKDTADNRALYPFSGTADKMSDLSDCTVDTSNTLGDGLLLPLGTYIDAQDDGQKYIKIDKDYNYGAAEKGCDFEVIFFNITGTPANDLVHIDNAANDDKANIGMITLSFYQLDK